MKNADRVARTFLLLALAAGLVLPTRASAKDKDDGDKTDGVFVMTNAADGNEIIAFARTDNGSLRETRRFDTGGRGSGGKVDPLGSQGALTLSQDHSLLFAVNAGSGKLSVFSVDGDHLSLEDKAPTGGSQPNAVAQNGNLVYVLNAGAGSNVVGFTVDHGKLTEIPGSTRFLSGNVEGAASISFSPNGKFLAVTERTLNDLDVFSVQSDGTLSPIVVTPSAGPGAFSVSFAPNGAALVSETGPTGGVNASAISSYAVLAGGTLSPISTSVLTLGAATCWQAITPDGRFVYTSNSGSSTISGFAIGANGSLTALAGTVVGANPSGATNLDVAVSSDGRFLYTLNSGNGTVGIFAIQKDGTLANLGYVTGLSAAAGFNGIAAD